MITMPYTKVCGFRARRLDAPCSTVASHVARWRADGSDHSLALCDGCAEIVRLGLAEQDELASWSVCPLPDLPALTAEQQRQRVEFAHELERIAELEERLAQERAPAAAGPSRLDPITTKHIYTGLHLRRIAQEITRGLDAGWWGE